MCLSNMAQNQVLDCNMVQSVLSEVRLIFANCNSEIQLELSELAIHSLKVICTFICKLLEGQLHEFISLYCGNYSVSYL